MNKKPKGNQKHLILSQRLEIEKALFVGDSFAAIARKLDKDPSGNNFRKIVVLSPSNEVLCASEQELKIDGIQMTISELEIDFKEDRMYWIFVYDNDNLINKAPISFITGE